MVHAKTLLNFFAFFLTVVFAVLLAVVLSSGPAKTAEIFLFAVILGAALGLIFRREWARKLLRGASLAGICYFAYKQIVVFHAADVTALAMMGIFAILIYFYRSGSLEVLYQNDNIETKKWTVLVVDDDLTFVKLVKSHFVKQGLTVISSDSGERGLEMAKRWKPDLIILDVILPGMKGRSVCAKLKEDSETEGIPVMFVTFKNSLDDISAEMELGAVMHLTKPVNYDHLYEQVHKILVKGK
jgi:CheY-like chemotaxis protein